MSLGFLTYSAPGMFAHGFEDAVAEVVEVVEVVVVDDDAIPVVNVVPGNPLQYDLALINL